MSSMDRNEWNKRIRDNVDSLLAERGFAPDCSIRNQLACMNFEVDFIGACANQQKAIAQQDEERAQANKPAFPTYYYDYQPSTGEQVVRDIENGITIRDYFAAAALTGLLSNHAEKLSLKDAADLCFDFAEQMIYERYKR